MMLVISDMDLVKLHKGDPEADQGLNGFSTSWGLMKKAPKRRENIRSPSTVSADSNRSAEDSPRSIRVFTEVGRKEEKLMLDLHVHVCRNNRVLIARA